MAENQQNNEPHAIRTDRTERLVSEGRVAELVAHLRANSFRYELSEQVCLVRRALAASAAKDQAGYIEELYALMLGITGDLMVLAQMPLLRRLDQVEQDVGRGSNSFAHDEVEKVLPTIERIHGHVVSLTKSLGTVRHTMSLRGKVAPDRMPVMRIIRDTEAVVERVKRECARASHG